MSQSKPWRFIPYELDYNFLDKCRKKETTILYVVGILSIIMPFFSDKEGAVGVAYSIIKFIDILCIIGYYTLNVVTEIFLYPKTANKRRMGLVDNSFGSNYLGKPTTGYYDNDELEVGTYKLITNCYESCVFTYNISKRMTKEIVIKNVLFSGVLIALAYFGMKNSLIAIPILQIFLSSLFLTELIHQLNFVSKLERLLERFQDMYVYYQKTDEFKEDVSKEIMFLLEYETVLAYNKAPTSNKIYNELRDKLNKEWEETKEQYEISR